MDDKIRLIAEYMDKFVVRRVLNHQSTGQSSIRGFVYPLIQSARGTDLKTLNRILNDFLKKSTYDPKVEVPISSLQFNFLRYFQYRINLYLTKKEYPAFNVFYKNANSIKLVYLEERNHETVVLPKNYQDDDVYPLSGIAFYYEDNMDEFGNQFYQLVNKPALIRKYDFDDDFKKTYEGLDYLQQRAFLLVNKIVKEMWG